MTPGAFTSQLDATEIIVAVFFLFFAGLILYLRSQDKLEGYPLVDISPHRTEIEGFPPMPPPKTYYLLEGGTTQMPHHDEEPSAVRAVPLLRFPAAPLVPVGDPMLAEVGPGAYPMRKDEPMKMEGRPQTQPLRVANDWRVAEGETDPRGMTVFDARGVLVGTVRDLWVDRSVKILRYLEVELDVADAPGRRVLLPIYYASIKSRQRRIRVATLLAHQFADVPGLAHTDQITAREEDRVNAYYAGGLLYSSGKEGGMHLTRRAAAEVRP
jgi:photosynthetic reaction center H subunit